METDIELLDGKFRRLEPPYKVRVDLAELSLRELLHLQAGIESAIAQKERGVQEGRCWHAPIGAVEVFVAK
jgi:hypothetical protein